MKTIDFEAHFYTPDELYNYFGNRKEYPIYFKDRNVLQLSDDFLVLNQYHMNHLASSLEVRLEEMEKEGVDMQILSHSPGLELIEKEDAIRESILANDYVYEATQKYPKNFMAYATLPVQDVQTACDEMERCKKMGFFGWQTFSNYGETNLDDDLYFPILAKAEELDMPVYIHPTQPISGRSTGLGPVLSGASFGFTVDTATTLIRMIYKGVFDRLPRLKILLGHLGEFFPFVLLRVDERAKLYFGSDDNTASCKNLPSYYFKNNIWVTTSGQYSHEAFACTKNVLGIDHILFGSDYPYEYPEEVKAFLDDLLLTQNERELLHYKNAENIFGITIPD